MGPEDLLGDGGCVEGCQQLTNQLTQEYFLGELKGGI